MPDPNPVYVVDLEPDEALALRAAPAEGASVLAELAPGQLVARLDDDDRGGWWQVFADTPGDGAYVGYLQARNVRPWSDAPPAQSIDPPTEEGGEAGPVTSPPPSSQLHAWPEPVGKPAQPGWNPLLPPARRHSSPNRAAADPARPRIINRVIIHVTGNPSFPACHETYMRSGPASTPYASRPQISPHYVVDKTGEIHQYVQESDVAWHAGIKAAEQRFYESGDWRRTIAKIKPASRYPAGSVFLGADGASEVGRESPAARYVRTPDPAGWAEYAPFDARWGRILLPIGYLPARSGNARSIGIEIASYGAAAPSAEHYTEAMYRALATLVADICARYELPQAKGVVVGHEDVNPLTRAMWDPGLGFDWPRIWAAGS